MGWQAVVYQVGRSGGNVTCTLTLTNDKTGEQIVDPNLRADTLTPDDVAKIVARRIAALDRRDESYELLKAVEGQTIEPATDDQDAALFFEQLAKLNATQLAIEKGLLKSDDADFAALKTTIKQTLSAHPEYRDDPRWR